MNTTISKNKSTTRTLISGRKRIFTGMKPTGIPHLGNYYGGILPALQMSHDPTNEVILMCADWHGLTNRSQILLAASYTHPLICFYLALGFKIENNSIILQSDYMQIQENSWYLSCATSAGLLERSHAYKDAIAHGKEASGGLLFYPVLMAADIMSFDGEFVPVGKDQEQHLEYASDMAKLFNNLVGVNVYQEAKAIIQDVPTLIGIDGERKMSKSYNNSIPIFASKKEIEKLVKEIKTDSCGLNDPKNPETCTIYQIFKSFASKEALNHMKERLINGVNYGYGHAKKDFLDEHERIFGSKRELYEHYVNSPKEVTAILRIGNERALSYAENVKKRVRTALGLKTYR